MTHYDAVIVGAGMVGATLAWILGQQGYRVLLIEKNMPRPVPQDVDMRTMALSYASIQYLKAWQIWPLLQAQATPIASVCVTQQGQLGATTLEVPHKYDEPVMLGHVVSVVAIDQALHALLATKPNITLLRPATFVSQTSHPLGWQIEIACDGKIQTMSTALLVATDGARSALAQANQISYQTTDYQQAAICANLVMEPRVPHTAYERFLKKGAIALLPWQSPYATCVWTCDGPAEPLMALSDQAYAQTCQQMLGRRVGKIQGVGKRFVLPLKMHLANQQTQQRFLVMGNAAHQVHPIAAQGLNISLQDMGQFWQILKRRQPTDLGDSAFLSEYQTACQPRQTAVTRTTHGIARYLAGSTLPASLKGLGLTLFELCPPLKQSVVRWGMGSPA